LIYFAENIKLDFGDIQNIYEEPWWGGGGGGAMPMDIVIQFLLFLINILGYDKCMKYIKG